MKVVPGVTPVHSEHRKYIHSLHEPTLFKEGGLTPKHPMLKADVRTCVTRDSYQISSQFNTFQLRGGTTPGQLNKNVVDICAILPIKELRNGQSVCDILTPSSLLQSIFLNSTNRSLEYCPDKAKGSNEMWFPVSLPVVADPVTDRPGMATDVGLFAFFNARGFGDMQGFFCNPAFSSTQNTDGLANVTQSGTAQPASLRPFNAFDLAKVPFGATISVVTTAPGGTKSLSQVVTDHPGLIVFDVPLWSSQRVILQKGMDIRRTRPSAYVRREGVSAYEPLRYRDLQTGVHTAEMYHRFTSDDVGKVLAGEYQAMLSMSPTTGDTLSYHLGRTSAMSRVNESMVGFTIPELLSLYQSWGNYSDSSRQQLDRCANQLLSAADGYRITNATGRINDPWNLNPLWDCTRFQASKVTLRFPSSKDIQQGIMQRLVLGDGRDHYSLSPFEVINHDETHTMNITSDRDSQISAVYSPVVEDDVRWDFESNNGFGDRSYAVILLTGLLGGSSTLASVATTPVPYNLHLEVQQRWEVYDPNDGIYGSPHPDSDFAVNAGKAIIDNMKPKSTGVEPPADSTPVTAQVSHVHSVATSASQVPVPSATVTPRSYPSYQSVPFGSPTVRYINPDGSMGRPRSQSTPRSPGLIGTVQNIANDLANAIPNAQTRREVKRAADSITEAARDLTGTPKRQRSSSRAPSARRTPARTVSATTPARTRAKSKARTPSRGRYAKA